MSLFGSISGFLSSIGAPPIVGGRGGPLTELSRSVLPRISPPHPTPSDASPTSVTSQPEAFSHTGSRRTSSSSSSCWSSRSSLVREGSTDPALTDVDLSHLTDEERLQIEAVMERARLIQEFDAYDLVTSSSAAEADPDPSAAETAEDARLLMGTEGRTSERPSDTCAICRRQPGIAVVCVCDGCRQPMQVCWTCDRSTPGDDASLKKSGETFLCPKCTATQVSSSLTEVPSAQNKSSDAGTELELEPEHVQADYEEQLTSHGVWRTHTSERRDSFEDSGSSPYSSSSSSSTDTSFDVPTPDGPDPEPLVLFSPEDQFSRTPEMDGTYSPTEPCAAPSDLSTIDDGGTSWWCSSFEGQELVDSDFFCDKVGVTPTVSLDLDDFEVDQKDDTNADEEAQGFGSESSTKDEGHASSTSVHLPVSASVHPPSSPTTDQAPSASVDQSDDYSWDAITSDPPYPGSQKDEEEEEDAERIPVPRSSSNCSSTELSVTDRTCDAHQSNGIFEVTASQFLALSVSEIVQDVDFGSQRSNVDSTASSYTSPPTKSRTNGNPFLTSDDCLHIESETFSDRSVEIYESLFDRRSSNESEVTSNERSFFPDASDIIPSDEAGRDSGSFPDHSAPPQFADYWDQSEEIREILRMPCESVSRDVHVGICETMLNTQISIQDETSFGTSWSLSPPESSSIIEIENNVFVFEHLQPEVTEPQIQSSSVKNSDGRTYSSETMKLYPVTEQPEVENLSSSRSLNAIGSLDTSPTLGMFKRCPSYSNILALPSLSTSGHLSNPLLSISKSPPTVRRNSEGSTPQNSASLDLAHLEEEETETSSKPRKQASQSLLMEMEKSDDSTSNSASRKTTSGQEEAVGEVRFSLGDSQLNTTDHLTDIVRKISPVAGAESTILWLDSSPVGHGHDAPDQSTGKDLWTSIPSQPDDPNFDSKTDTQHYQTPPNCAERSGNEFPSSPVNEINKAISSTDQSSETQSETSRSSGFIDERRASLTPPSDALTVIGADEQIFLSDEELREIDLDEDIPPKHLLVRRTSRPKLPFCSAKSAPTFGRRVFEGLTDQWEPRWDELGSVAFGKLDGERVHDKSEFRDQAGSLDDLHHRQVRRRLPAIPPSSEQQWNSSSSAAAAAAAAAAAGRPLRLAEIKKIRPMLKTRSLSADATHHSGGGSLGSSSRQRPNPKCLAMSRSLSIEGSRTRDVEQPAVVNVPFHQDNRSGRSVSQQQHQQPDRGDARHRRSSSAKARSKSAEVAPPKAPVSSVLPPRSYSADDRRADNIRPQLTGTSFTSGFRNKDDSGMNGYTTTTSLNEYKDGAGDESGRTALQDEQETLRKTEIEAASVRQDLVDTSEDESGRATSKNQTVCPLVPEENAKVPVAKSRQKVPPKIPPKPRKCLKKEIKDDPEEPPPFVSVFGLSVPTSVHSWMLRVKDEVKIVTATKRLRLDEAEEVRIMEAELAVRTKERRRSALIAEQEEREKRRAKAAEEKAEAEADLANACNASESMYIQKRFFDSDVHTKHFLSEDHGSWNTAPADQHPFRVEESAAASQFAIRHKRQASDPIFSVAPRLLKNSDLGYIPTDFETLPRFDRSSKVALERAAPQPIHLGITVLTQRKADVSPPNGNGGSQAILLTENIPQGRSVSASRLSSASTGSLPVMLATSSEYRMEFYARECEALRKKKEKIDRLQREIDRRRQHLAETLRQCERLRIDAYRPAPESPHPVGHDEGPSSSSLPASGADEDPESKGLIRPIDFPIDPEKYYVKFEPPTPAPRSSAPNPEHLSDSSVYSSFEYIVHKTEHAHQKNRRPESAFRGVSSSPAWSSLPHSGQPRRQDVDSHALSDAAPYSESEDAYYYSHGTYGSSSHDSGVSSTITGTDTLPFREQTPPPAPPARPPPRAVGDRRRGTRPPDRGPPSYVPANGTPPMPILDDVANRSRSVLRGMGSRPLSDDMEKYFHSEEPLQLMYKEGSEGSVAESMEESAAMEGGTTLRRNMDRRQFRAVISSLHKYSFPTKRILLTSDSKDRTFKGFGIKIRGGQVLPWMGDDVGAYVAYIYPGSSADQLHGELQEGDQVLEINGEPLGGKTELELRQILARCNCEMELVVRHGVNMRSYPSNTMSTLSTLQTDSNRSSYDNIPTVSSCDGLDSFDGLDKESTQLLVSDVLDSVLDRKAVLLTSGVVRLLDDDVGDRRTPSLLSGNDDSVRSLGSRDRRHFDNKRCTTSPSNRDNGFLGEIQLQLSYDDYDCTLNVHVIQARYLQPVKFKSGYADPFVKVYLLPYKSRTESKRRAKCVPRTLNPEWHRTMVFLDVRPSELPLKTLDVSVWDHDHLLPDQLMGHVSLDLSDLSLLDNRPRWYQLIDEHGRRTSGNNGRGPSLVANGGAISSSDSAHSSSSSNLSKPSNRDRSRNHPDRKSPWSNPDRVTPKPSAAAPSRPSPRNTPDGWMNGGPDQGQQHQVGLLRLQEDSISDVNSINRNAYLLCKTTAPVAENDALVRRSQQPVITHQRNSVHPITRKMENPAPWRVVDPSRRHSPDVRIEAQCEIKFETRPKGSNCYDCLLLFFCCSRSRGVAPHTAL